MVQFETPAMEAGLAEHVWTVEELASLLEQDTMAAKNMDTVQLIEGLRP